MGCAASSDTGTEYVSLGHHGNRHVSKKPGTPSDAQLYGNSHNKRRKSSSSSSSSSSSDDEEKKKDKNQPNGTSIVPPPSVKLTENDQRQQDTTPPQPDPFPPPEEMRDPVPPPLTDDEKQKDQAPLIIPARLPPIEDKKEERQPSPVPPPQEEEKQPSPVPPPQEKERQPSPLPSLTEERQNTPPPCPPIIQQKEEDDVISLGKTSTDNVEENKDTPPKNDPEPEPPAPTGNIESEPIPPAPTGNDDPKPIPPPPTGNDDPEPIPPPPNDNDDPKPIPPAPEDNYGPEPIPPVPTGNLDFNNTDGMESPKPPDFTVSDYVPTDIGTFDKFLDYRTNSEEFYNPTRPDPNDNGLYTDHDFPVEKAVPNGGCNWQRPEEICENPALFTDGTTRFDIGQGRFGTCWFLSMVANIADKPRLLRRVIPKSGYKVGTPEYDGIFQCRFWRFGQWSDVYIDDFLPTSGNGHLYGASNNSDRNEMWVALLEKAFARMYGSYEEVTGGRTADAFMNLTAGVGETIKFGDMKKSPSQLFQRLTHAFQSPTTMVGCVCPSKNDGQHGLVGGHAYSMNGTFKYGNTMLVRIRNPWGRQEWNGPWSDGSAEMERARNDIPHPNKDDGEFYMAVDDFLRYFEQCTICNITPDFDRDGNADTLNHVTTIYGNWRRGKAGGFREKLQNPMYCVTVNDDAADENGKVPLVVQIVQKTTDRQDDKIGIRVDLYKVLHEDSGLIVLDELGEKNNLYLIDFSACYRFAVTPGKYVAVPSSMKSSDEDPKVLKEFLVRYFSAGPLSDPFEVKDNTKVIAGKGPELTVNDQVLELPNTSCITGKFVTGHNAGGQISCSDTFASNPQFFLTINDPQTIKVEIMQPDPENPNAKMPLGIKLFKAGVQDYPADYEWLCSNYGNAVKDTTGDDGRFSHGNCVESGYSLEPGTYILIIHANGPEDENDFALAIYSEKHVQVQSTNV